MVKEKWEVKLDKQTESKDLLECCFAVLKYVFYAHPELQAELQIENGTNQLDYLLDRLEAEIKRLNEKE